MLLHRQSLLEVEVQLFEDDFNLGGHATSDASPPFLSDHKFQQKYRMQ